MPSYKTQLRHRLRLQNKRLKRLQTLVTDPPTWADNLLEWVGKHHRKAEVSVARILLRKTAVPVTAPHARSLRVLREAGLVVISEGFAVLAKQSQLSKVYSNEKNAGNSKYKPQDESQNCNDAARRSSNNPKEENQEDTLQQVGHKEHGHEERQDPHTLKKCI